MFQRREKIRTQTAFFFADSIEIPALQQQCKETLSEIFRLFWPDALSSYETVNRSLVGAAKFFECLPGRGRWTLCREYTAPVRGSKRHQAVIGASALCGQRSQLIICRRHAVIQTKSHARSKPGLSSEKSAEFVQIVWSPECGAIKDQWSLRISAADLAKHFADRGNKVTDVFLVDAADGSDPKAVGLAQLAGIDDEAARTETTREIFESEVRIIRVTKRGDDVALALCGQVLGETKPPHSRSQCLVISAMAGGASGDTALFAQFFERSGEGEKRMRGRRETELAIPFKTFPLCEQVETDASRTAFTRFERFASRQDKGEAGDAFETFIRRRN